ncbi:hypothetical protein N1614_04295 [Adlercreutzia muris]|uniref:hypothetical protein n=1 Tax=Adlercreutzia muris TaxID=1796610 RepID=UPI0021D6119C|nr:hypothetical protein [Adlercreutzia muris]MCU7584568.1 hypothetical protein [Adlercreutzia muris]
MDATVIEEIAKQLGMAVDQAAAFVSANLPAYAGLKAMQAAVPLAIVWSLVLLFALIAAVSLSLAARERRKCMAEDDRPRWHSTHKWENYTDAAVAAIAASVGAVFLVIAVLVTAVCVPEFVGWQQYPEAMLIDMALKAVG